MIARPAECNHWKLAQLLSDTLPEHEHAPLTIHLDDCESCREQLDLLTQQTPLFRDTAVALSSCDSFSVGDSSSNSDVANLRSDDGSFDREHWVCSLLEPSEEAATLGTLDSLRVYGVLGQGGMGVVVRALDPALGRDLAVKLLSPMLSSCGTARQRFFREAQAAAAVVHPNIVPIFSVSEQQSSGQAANTQNVAPQAKTAPRPIPYITMPLITGGNLQQLLDRDGPLPVERVLSIGHQIAEGLAAAHAQGIIHRDIKPANLMLDGGGFRVMITDFGLARALDDTTMTGSGMLAGTPQYMSPEQARGQTLDHRSDLYSLGAVLYALATGRPPVSGTSTMEILHNIGKRKQKPVSEVNELYPEWFDRLVLRLMQPQVEKRIATAEDAASILRESLSHARSPRRVPLPAVLRKPLHWKSAAGIFTAGAALATCALVGAVLFGAIGLPREFRWGITDSTESADSSATSQGGFDASQPELESFAPRLPEPNSQPPASYSTISDAQNGWTPVELNQELDALEIEIQQLKQEIGL